MTQRLQAARAEAELAASKLQTVADEMRVFSRRTPEEGDSAYVVYATSHLRFAGAILQSAKRTSSMDRLLQTARQEQEEVRLREADQMKKREARDTRRRFQKLEIPTDHDFEELYGEIVKSHGTE